jgi:hypothetical protein
MNDWIGVAMEIFAVGTVVAVYATGRWAKPGHAKGSAAGTKVLPTAAFADRARRSLG